MEAKRTFKVLIIEDTKEICDLYRMAFEMFPEYDLFFASDVTSGLTLLAEHPDAALIVVDYQLENEQYGDAFARRARETYRGPMLASSSFRDCNEKLLEAGCDHVAWPKHGVPSEIKRILKARQP